MRLIAVFAAALALLLGWGLPAAGSLTVPSLRLLSRAPITVQGMHFRARERVRVTLLAARDRVVRVTTSAAGVFTARFAGISADRCADLSIQAVGAGGERALLKVRPLCPPA
jgi:hypothetical protein